MATNTDMSAATHGGITNASLFNSIVDTATKLASAAGNVYSQVTGGSQTTSKPAGTSAASSSKTWLYAGIGAVVLVVVVVFVFARSKK